MFENRSKSVKKIDTFLMRTNPQKGLRSSAHDTTIQIKCRQCQNKKQGDCQHKPELVPIFSSSISSWSASPQKLGAAPMRGQSRICSPQPMVISMTFPERIAKYNKNTYHLQIDQSELSVLYWQKRIHFEWRNRWKNHFELKIS